LGNRGGGDRSDERGEVNRSLKRHGDRRLRLGLRLDLTFMATHAGLWGRVNFNRDAVGDCRLLENRGSVACRQCGKGGGHGRGDGNSACEHWRARERRRLNPGLGRRSRVYAAGCRRCRRDR